MSEDRRGPRRRGGTKADLADFVYRSHGGLTRQEAAGVVDKILETMKTSLLDGQAVKIQNFGVLEVVPRRGRMGVNPTNGERMFIPPRKGLAFRPAPRLKDTLVKEPDGGGAGVEDRGRDGRPGRHDS